MKITAHPFIDNVRGLGFFKMSDADVVELDVKEITKWGLLRHGGNDHIWMVAEVNNIPYIVLLSDHYDKKWVCAYLRFRSVTIEPPSRRTGRDWMINWDEGSPRVWTKHGLYWRGNRCIYSIERTHKPSDRFAVVSVEEDRVIRYFRYYSEARVCVMDALDNNFTIAEAS